MRVQIFTLKNAEGNFVTYGGITQDETGGWSIDDIVVLGDTPELAGASLTEMLTEAQATEGAV